MVSNFVDAAARRAVLAERAVACAASPELDRLAAAVAEVFQVPHAAISVTNGHRQKIVAGFGLDGPLIGDLETALRSPSPQENLPQERRSDRLAFLQWVPLNAGDEHVGCLAIASEAPRCFSARGEALLEVLAAVVLDQLYLGCAVRKQSDLAGLRLAEGRTAKDQIRELRRRLSQIARLGRIGGWVFDIESDQLLWTDDLAGGLADETRELASTGLLSLTERTGHEAVRQALRRTIEHGVPLELEHSLRSTDGVTYWVRMVGEVERDKGAGGQVVGIVQDVSERYRADEKITYLSQYDVLTGLPNRAVFQDKLHAAVRWAGRSGGRGAVLVLDIDGFSEINDTLGYQRGDSLLAQLAERLQAVVRASDSVGRLAGDRFGVVTSGLEAAGDVMKLAERLLQAAAEVLGGARSDCSLTASIGIALFPGQDRAAGQLLRSAEFALQHAKAAGGGTYAFFTADMGALAERRRQLMSDVRAGLAADQFVVCYQPKIELRSNRLAGFEALIRWAHPERGLLAPASFWEALSDPVLGRELSDTVLVKVVRQMEEWRGDGHDLGPVAVNVAPGQLRDPNFLHQIKELLSASKLPTSALRLEITENVLLGRRSDRAVRALGGIHEIGIDTELDDFGTGYASLSHLREFPINRLKIDRSFIADLANPQNETIVRAVIEMAHGLGMEVVAEGVETAESDKRLRQLGCDYGQGFLYSPPIPADAVVDFARQWDVAARKRLLRLIG